MTFQKNKNQNSQAGVTLILGILLLSAVLAISFSLTTIIFIEVKSSSDLLKTEGSLYGATGVGEQAFFNYIRNVEDPDSYISSFNNNVSLKGAPELSTTTNASFTDYIQTGSNFSNTKKIYEFCPTGAQDNGCDFGKIVLKFSSAPPGSYLFAYLCEWDPNPNGPYPSAPCSVENVGDGYWIAPVSDPTSCGVDASVPNLGSNGSIALIPNSNMNCASWTLNPNLQQELIITNPSSPGTIFYTVSTFDNTGNIGKGLPYVGKTGVIIRTENGQVGRKVKVEVPSD